MSEVMNVGVMNVGQSTMMTRGLQSFHESNFIQERGECNCKFFPLHLAQHPFLFLLHHHLHDHDDDDVDDNDDDVDDDDDNDKEQHLKGSTVRRAKSDPSLVTAATRISQTHTRDDDEDHTRVLMMMMSLMMMMMIMIMCMMVIMIMSMMTMMTKKQSYTK